MGSGFGLLPRNLSEFCDLKYWDAFFKARGGRPFEWYGDWKLISKLVIEQCGLKTNSEQKILIPGCGNSALSAGMYDGGFVNITNIDFSRGVISEMLRRHVRSRPRMRWQVMDMTKMQLSDESFDVVVDKAGLDALLGEPEDDRSSGFLFLSEVKRVLKPSGCFICVTLAQQHVIESLLFTFRKGWHLSVHGLQLSAADAPSSLQPFLVIAKQESGENLPQVSFGLDLDWQGASNKIQMQAVVNAVDAENVLRREGLPDRGISTDLEINPKDSFKIIHPGRRLMVKLYSPSSKCTYTAVILDTEEGELEYQCAVFLVPQGRGHEWLFSSVEGQWQVSESTKAGRLILVSMDPNQDVDINLEVKDDLSPLVKYFLPLESRESRNVPYMTQGDGITARNILAEVASPITGSMVIEDVFLADEISGSNKPAGATLEYFRRLVFRRNPYLIQSEALLIREKVQSKIDEKGRSVGEPSRKHGTSRRKKKAAKEVVSVAKPGLFEELKVDHSYLASPYHAGMIAAFVLIAKNLEQWLASKQDIRLMLVGLGAGLLPMFVHNHLPIDNIQIVELDPVVGDLAKLHFGFIEDDRMKLQIGDGLVAVQSVAAAVSPSNVQNEALQDDSAAACQIREEGSKSYSLELSKHLEKLEIGNGGNKIVTGEDKGASSGLHILLIDADSDDLSSGLSCPPAAFLEDSFLLAARAALVDGGILIINVVSRATSSHVRCVDQLKRFFEELYDIEVSEDVNRVLIALPRSRNSGESSNIMEDLSKLENIAMQFAPWGNGPNLKELVRDLKRLK